MTQEARDNGWLGFENIAYKVDGGWEYRCDGVPHPMGCGASIVVTRRWSRVGLKKASGWLVCYGIEDEGGGERYLDKDVVLTFCPECAQVVAEQDKAEDFDKSKLALR